jgi:hypothetical protein
MIFRHIFKRKSFFIFLFFLFILSNTFINADSSNELQADKRDILPDSNKVPDKKSEEVVDDAEV